ncbi:lipase maturation factor family protein, partial [Acinetobacter baumannii]
MGGTFHWLSSFFRPSDNKDLDDARFPTWIRTPWVLIWGNRWLLFRIMLGAGLIKIRGDECWRDLTCMNYH